MATSRPLSTDGPDRHMVVRMFLGSGSGYHGDRKRQNDCESDHDPDLTHPPAHTTCLDHNAGCRPTKARLIGSLVQIVGRLKHGGFPQPLRDSPMNSSDNLSGLGQMVRAMSDWQAWPAPKSPSSRHPACTFLFVPQAEPPTYKIWRKSVQAIGRKRWAIAEGYIPSSTGPHPQMTSHETVCLLNAGPQDAHVSITVFYADRPPVGPYRLLVPAERTRHVRFNDLSDPAPIPVDRDFASLIESDVPIVVQHTRLDSTLARRKMRCSVRSPSREMSSVVEKEADVAPSSRPDAG